MHINERWWRSGLCNLKFDPKMPNLIQDEEEEDGLSLFPFVFSCIFMKQNCLIDYDIRSVYKERIENCIILKVRRRVGVSRQQSLQ